MNEHLITKNPAEIAGKGGVQTVTVMAKKRLYFSIKQERARKFPAKRGQITCCFGYRLTKRLCADCRGLAHC